MRCCCLSYWIHFSLSFIVTLFKFVFELFWPIFIVFAFVMFLSLFIDFLSFNLSICTFSKAYWGTLLISIFISKLFSERESDFLRPFEFETPFMLKLLVLFFLLETTWLFGFFTYFPVISLCNKDILFILSFIWLLLPIFILRLIDDWLCELLELLFKRCSFPNSFSLKAANALVLSLTLQSE